MSFIERSTRGLEKGSLFYSDFDSFCRSNQIRCSAKMNNRRKNASQLGFPLEDRLLTILRKTAYRLIISKQCSAVQNFTKFSVGMVIPDLVVVATHRGRTQQSRKSKPPSLFDCAILAQLMQRGPSSEEAIAKALYTRLQRIQIAARRLARLGFIVVETSGCLAINDRVFSATARIYSFEAKLRRWKEALSQALTYKRFSNAAYVALPTALIQNNVRVQKLCKAQGIGLVAVDQSGTKLMVKPKFTQPKTAEWIWLMMKAAATRRPKQIIIKTGHLRLTGR